MRIQTTDKCGMDWKNMIRQLWADSQETVKTVEVNGERHYPDGNGLVSFETWTQVLDNEDYYTLVCQIQGGSVSTLSELEGYWLLTTQYIYEMNDYYDLNESDSFAIADEGANFLITTTG